MIKYRPENLIAKLVKEEGAAAVEYAVLIALIIAICIAVITSIGMRTTNLYESLNSVFN